MINYINLITKAKLIRIEFQHRNNKSILHGDITYVTIKYIYFVFIFLVFDKCLSLTVVA